MTFKELKEIYDLTGINVALAIAGKKLEEVDPKVLQLLVWWNRRKTNPDLKLEDVNDFKFVEAVQSFDELFREE
jgi:hypothetical protein